MSVTGQEDACPRCGKKFDRYVKFECPFCGELVLIGTKRCPFCKLDLSGLSDSIKPPTVEKTMDELLNDLIEIESTHVEKADKKFCCPKCTCLLDGTETKCPRCGQALTGNMGLRCPICGTSTEKGMKVCPRCGITLEKVSEEAKPLISFVPAPKREPVPEPKVEDFAATRTCPECGALSAKILSKCPKCNASFVKEKPQPKFVEPPKETKKGQYAEEALLALSEIEKQAQRPIKERRLKSEKVTRAPVTSKQVYRGLSNGIGQVNGRSKINGVGAINGRSKVNGLGMVNGKSMVNGAGAVNGRALVNGTGVSNGLRARARSLSANRTMLFTRWQFLAVLVAIAVVLPTFLFLSYSELGDEFAVDGEFDDWANAVTYGTRIQSTSPRTNVTEWAVGVQSGDLFLYFRTQSQMMSSPEAESFYLFVDSDGSNATGYVMESIGAEYMLRLTGWDNAVNSTSISEYPSSSDRYNWNAWTATGEVSHSLKGVRLEAKASMPVTIGQSAKFMLVSKDFQERGSVSYASPLKGGVLVVEQAPSSEVDEDGLVPRSGSVTVLSLRFTCEGAGGRVDNVYPVVAGAVLSGQIASFSLSEGQEHQASVTVDTMSAADGGLVSAKVLASGIASSFANVVIVGDGASAYVSSSPQEIVIDGAFADWEGLLSIDQDALPVANPDVDIDEVGNLSTADSSYFYVSVEDEICSGTFVPATISKPSGSGGGGVVILPRHTAEDILRIYIDSDRSNSTGETMSYDSKVIGADQMIEVKGVFGRITSLSEFNYSSGNWTQSSHVVEAAKDAKRIEIGISSASIGGSSDIDFLVETTTWKGRSDLAIFDPSSMKAMTRSWVVESSASSAYATAMSYQRKVFYDGTNYWSFYFDGSDTVHKYSTDDGVTWTGLGAVFKTSGVNETSLWYDASTSTVYAVGDTSSASTSLYLQTGTVNPAAHTISWAETDSTFAASSNPLGGKNAYISKDANGYLWVMSSNCTQASPGRYQLTVFRSSSVNSTNPWVFSAGMLAPVGTLDNIKGSVVPAGSGSNVWAVYAYGGNVASRKYTGTWQSTETVIYPKGAITSNTDNSPPSVVVDGKGVVHVVYGTGRKTVQSSIPSIEYSRNNTGATTFTSGLDLDPSIPGDVGDYYPTISLESSTGDLYVYWLRSDSSLVPMTLMGKTSISGSWSDLTFESQTSYAKQYLTSIYSVSGKFKVCWQWTQNTTSPFNVLFDHNIPEFGDLALPIVLLGVILTVHRQRSRGRDKLAG